MHGTARHSTATEHSILISDMATPQHKLASCVGLWHQSVPEHGPAMGYTAEYTARVEPDGTHLHLVQGYVVDALLGQVHAAHFALQHGCGHILHLAQMLVFSGLDLRHSHGFMHAACMSDPALMRCARAGRPCLLTQYEVSPQWRSHSTEHEPTATRPS